VCIVLGQLAWYYDPPEKDQFAWLRSGSIVATVVITALSIITYVRRAYAFLLSSAALGGTAAATGPPPSTSPESTPSAADSSRQSESGGSQVDE